MIAWVDLQRNPSPVAHLYAGQSLPILSTCWDVISMISHVSMLSNTTLWVGTILTSCDCQLPCQTTSHNVVGHSTYQTMYNYLTKKDTHCKCMMQDDSNQFGWNCHYYHSYLWRHPSIFGVTRFTDHFLYAPHQWEMKLQCNVISHWLGTTIERSLQVTLLNVFHQISLDTIHIPAQLLIFMADSPCCHRPHARMS